MAHIIKGHLQDTKHMLNDALDRIYETGELLLTLSLPGI
jgi:hypothetical protein